MYFLTNVVSCGINVFNVFTNFHYEVHLTGTDSSHQNGPIERAHRTVDDHVRAFLIGASLDIKFRPYASLCILMHPFATSVS